MIFTKLAAPGAAERTNLNAGALVDINPLTDAAGQAGTAGRTALLIWRRINWDRTTFGIGTSPGPNARGRTIGRAPGGAGPFRKAVHRTILRTIIGGFALIGFTNIIGTNRRVRFTGTGLTINPLIGLAGDAGAWTATLDLIRQRIIVPADVCFLAGPSFLAVNTLIQVPIVWYTVPLRRAGTVGIGLID